jgi:thiamine pyrophosphokinase
MKRAIIFYNGDLSDLTNAKKYIKPDDYIICADGGTRYALALGLKPNTILGDLDSLSSELQESLKDQEIEWITYNKEKDETDSELALIHAIEKGYTTILLFGVFGSRIDHMLTNIFALEYLLKNNIEATIIEGLKEIRVIDKSITLHGKVGDLLSLVPLQKTVKKVKTENLQYPLHHEDLFFGYSRGISNVFTKSTAEVSIESGKLLVIHEKVEQP